MSFNNNNIDNNLYDRQIRTYGVEAVKKMSTSSVLIMGLAGGLGTEIAKNLALGGIKNIYLSDTQVVSPDDLCSGFYYSQESVGALRNKTILPKLSELNPYVTIHTTDTFEEKQDVTILVNQPVIIVNQVSEYCRNSGSKLVVLYSKGVSGVVFVDAGSSHIVNDTTGENIELAQIGEISSGGQVKCTQHASHDFQTGDFITLTNLVGTNLNQFNKEWKIKVNTKTNFDLVNFDDIEPFTFVNGTAHHVKKQVEINHQSWNDQILNPSLAYSFDMEYSKQLVLTYLSMYGSSIPPVSSIPDIWSDEMEYHLEKHSVPLVEHAKTFSFELIPVVSLMGSIAASEAIKLVTNKYIPINQWFTWSDNTLIPKSAPSDWNLSKTVYGKLYGCDLESKLINSKWLMVGSGAIGCEHLKNLALMNVADHNLGSYGEIILTDPDSIEKSNLNRQFLFRSHHIGKSKSETAASAIKNMRAGMKVTPLIQKVGHDNTAFTNSIMPKVTGVLNALDNINARRFMDEQCFKYGLPLFESGTTATKGNTQPVIPFVTETYSASSDPDQEKSFPICTIKSFPNEIAHTIHWAMDQFEFFNRGPTTLNEWINNPTYIDELDSIEKAIALDDINLFTCKYPTQLNKINECAKWAVDMFNENYNNSIKQLLHSFSPTHEVAPGILFWSSGKRCPVPINFDINNSLHMDYIEATTHIIARCSGLEDNFTRDDLVKMIADYEPSVFVLKDIQIAGSDAELEKLEQQPISNTNDIEIGCPNNFTAKFVPQEFEKDDDSNWHIDWITAGSNLRAYNYGIPKSDRLQTKGIAGRIIPAIATTTSAVSGLIMLEMLKYLIGFDKNDLYRSTFINLAEPVLVYSDPIESSQIDVAGVKMNSWTKFEYVKNTSLGEFKQYYEEMFKTNISMIVLGSNMVYAEFFESNSLDKSLAEIMCGVMETTKVPQMVTFILISDEDTKEIPAITVNLTLDVNTSYNLHELTA